MGKFSHDDNRGCFPDKNYKSLYKLSLFHIYIMTCHLSKVHHPPDLKKFSYLLFLCLPCEQELFISPPENVSGLEYLDTKRTRKYKMQSATYPVLT